MLTFSIIPTKEETIQTNSAKVTADLQLQLLAKDLKTCLRCQKFRMKNLRNKELKKKKKLRMSLILNQSYSKVKLDLQTETLVQIKNLRRFRVKLLNKKKIVHINMNIGRNRTSSTLMIS